MVSTRVTTSDPGNCPGPEDQNLSRLRHTQSISLLVGKTAHNVGRLACILGLTNPQNQSSEIPTENPGNIGERTAIEP